MKESIERLTAAVTRQTVMEEGLKEELKELRKEPES